VLYQAELRSELFTVSNLSGGYYGLVETGGKQFRRSLKTGDRKLAERRLKELKDKIGVLRVSEEANCDFKTLGDRWLDSRKHKLADTSPEWYGYSGARVAEITGGRKKKNPLIWSNVNFENNMVFLPGTKTESSPRWIPMSGELRGFLERLKAEKNPKPEDPIIPISSARKCLETACRKLGFSTYTHHDFRHFFATTCIESGVDVPTVSRWLGHCDGGALAMKRYGHLRQEHSLAMSKKVHFEAKQDHNIFHLPSSTSARTDEPKQNTTREKQAIAKCKAQYAYPWWASENSVEVFWGQLNEDVPLISRERYLGSAKLALGREVFESELDDRESLIYELVSRISKTAFERLALRIPPRKVTVDSMANIWQSAS